MYAAAGMALWGETNAGLIGRVGEDYPQDWLAKITKIGFDTRGVRVLPQSVDLRWFAVYPDGATRQTENAIAFFSREGIPFPKSLLGYDDRPAQPDRRDQPTPLTIRKNDFPVDYLDARAAHLCPMDFLSHTLLPQVLRDGRAMTITLDPGEGYMSPLFWDDVPSVFNGLTAVLTSESKLSALFHGRSNDVWEMAEALAGFGCEMVVIKRGARGQYLYDRQRKQRWMIPAYPVTVKDPTGAGNAFCGGFLTGFSEHYDPLEACLHGNISASFVVEAVGPFAALEAYRPLVQARLDALADMVRTV
jgi:sugar/nucleoside kinase (ribokinase family)